ncbi:MAG: cyclic nucleotide-binding domain-containing protein [Chitinivibrionales bacterium]|nr:cyclic nucleotide-binding domain-containing protein [Chitinivibrionales bacterium]
MPDKEGPVQSVRHFDPGEDIIQEGSLGRGLYVLLRGKLIVMRDGVRIASITQKGSYVGEISAILGCTCTATVRAEEPSELLYVERVTEYLENNPQASYVLAQTLAKRLMDMNQKFISLERMLRKLATPPVREKVDDEAMAHVQEAIEEMHNLLCADTKPRPKRPPSSAAPDTDKK